MSTLELKELHEHAGVECFALKSTKVVIQSATWSLFVGEEIANEFRFQAGAAIGE